MERLYTASFDMVNSFSVDIDPDCWKTQACVYYVLFTVGMAVLYFAGAGLSYLHSFEINLEFAPATANKEGWRRQALQEITVALQAIVFTPMYIIPAAVMAHRGHAKLYTENPSDLESWGHVFLSLLGMLIFTDFGVYFIHRACHHPLLYKFIHKPHHQFQYPTPFASLAVDPLEAAVMVFPYYAFVFIFPMHCDAFLFTLCFAKLWAINVHDQIDIGPFGVLNTTGHHTIHQTQPGYNFGQYTTIPDRLFGTYKPAVQTHDLATGRRVLPPVPLTPPAAALVPSLVSRRLRARRG